MRAFLALLQMTLRAFARSRFVLIFSFLLPVLMIVLIGMASSSPNRGARVGVVLADSDPVTQRLVDLLDRAPLQLSRGADLDSELRALADGARAIVIAFPPQLGMAREGAPMRIQLFRSRAAFGEAASAELLLGRAVDDLLRPRASKEEAIEIVATDTGEAHKSYIEFLLPGLIALSIMQMCVLSVANVIVSLRENGIFKRLLVTPMTPFEFISANVAARLIVALVQSSCLLLAGYLFFHITVTGSYLLVFSLIALGALMFLGLGLTISSIASSAEAVPLLANLAIFPMLFLGSTFIPVSDMSGWLAVIAGLLPLTHLSEALRATMNHAATLRDVAFHVGILAAWSALFLLAATLAFHLRWRRE